MRRFVLAAVTVAALGSSALAQPTPSFPVPHPNPIPPPATYAGPPGPAVPIYKSGGVVTGARGYYTYDTGDWLLGGTGITRQNGFFTMVYPGGNAPAYGSTYDALPYNSGYSKKHKLFHR